MLHDRLYATKKGGIRGDTNRRLILIRMSHESIALEWQYID